jgi:hypothetical protein
MKFISDVLNKLLFNIVLNNKDMRMGIWRSLKNPWKENYQKQFL